MVSVFTYPESLLPILRILNCFATGRHEWAANPASIKAAHDYLTVNAPNLAATYADLGEKAIVGAAWRTGARAITVQISVTDLDEAVDDLCRPAVLVVENATSDGHFVRSVATVFDSDLVLRALDEDWLTIRQAGGSGQLRTIAEHERAKFTRHTRVVVLFDSDSMAPEHETQNHKDASKLESTGITVHVLRLREAENYVPNRVLASFGHGSDLAEKLDHLKLLKLEQRGHLDMKKGFTLGPDGPKVPDTQQELFDDVKPATLKVLCGGFGHGLLPRLADVADSLSCDDFARIGVDGELRDLLVKIEAVI
jgi:hypothetical protein